MKRFLSLTLCAFLILGFILPAYATGTDETTAPTETTETVAPSTTEESSEPSTSEPVVTDETVEDATEKPEEGDNTAPSTEAPGVTSEDVPVCTCPGTEEEKQNPDFVHVEGCPYYVEPADPNAELFVKLMSAETVADFEAALEGMNNDEISEFLGSLTEQQLKALEEHIEAVWAAEPVDMPKTKVFTNAGPFMPAVSVKQFRAMARAFSLTRDAQQDNGLELSKQVIRANDDGSYTIRIEAYTTGNVITSTKTVPVDIVLVLDQSGSMAYDFSGNSTNTNSDRRQYAMKQAVNNFISSVGEKYSEEADHRISIVTFGSNATTLQGWTFVDGSGVNTLQSQISNLPNSPSGATNVAAGMTQAENLMGAGYRYSGSNTERQKVVIVFTDGVPTTQSDFDTTVASNAISSAKNLKDGGSTVYTVGIFNGANPSELHGEKWDYTLYQDILCSGEVGSYWGGSWLSSIVGSNDFNGIDIAAGNRFLNYLSSNCPNSTSIGLERGSFNPSGKFGGDGTGYKITQNFNKTSSDYYLTANDSSSLNQIFKTISNNIQTANINLGSETQIVDTVSDYFVIPEGTSDIKLYTAAAKADGSFEDAVTAPASVVATTTSGSVSVTGFDFNANFVSDKVKDDGTYGKKLIIEFNVVPKDGFLGGNDVPTNDWEQSAVYHKDGTEVEKFTDASGTPTVNVDIDSVSVTPSNMNVYLLANLTGDQIQSMTSVKVGNIDLDFTATNYGLATWQNEYVNISIEVKDKDGNIVTALNGLAEDQTYTITVMVTPKTDVSTSVGAAATSSSGSNSANIHVFAPEITWQDTVIEANQGPCYTQNFAGLRWFHLNGTQKTYSDSVSMIGQEPSLTYEYNPPVVDSTTNSAAPISTDSFVDVTVKLGSHDITSYVDFLHKCECDLQIPCQWTDTDHGGAKGAEFIVHVSTFNLTITKNGTKSIDQVTGESQSYIFHVTGPNGFKMDVVICGDGSKTIKNLPVGDYTITEEENWSWRYTAQPYTVKADSIKGGSATVTVENTRDNDKWLNGGAYVSNLFGKLKSGN